MSSSCIAKTTLEKLSPNLMELNLTHAELSLSFTEQHLTLEEHIPMHFMRCLVNGAKSHIYEAKSYPCGAESCSYGA